MLNLSVAEMVVLLVGGLLLVTPTAVAVTLLVTVVRARRAEVVDRADDRPRRG